MPQALRFSRRHRLRGLVLVECHRLRGLVLVECHRLRVVVLVECHRLRGLVLVESHPDTLTLHVCMHVYTPLYPIRLLAHKLLLLVFEV